VRSGILALTLAILSVSACDWTRDADSSRRPTLRDVPLPDLSAASEPVQRQIRDAHIALRSALDRPQTSMDVLAERFGDVGRLLIAAEYYDAAEICFVNARSLQPREMRWPYYLGHVSRLRNNPADAVTHFESALAQAPDHVPSMVWLAEMQLALGRADAARTTLERARSREPENAAVLASLGRTALAAREYAPAVAHFQAALQRAPHANRLHYQLALAYRGLGDTRAAEEQLRRRGEVDALPDDPLLDEITGALQNAAAFENRGSAAITAKLWPVAVDNLRRAIALAPENALSRLNLGTALYMQNDTDGALEQYREAIRLAPGLAKAHFGAGVILESRGADADAIEAFTSAIRQDAGYVEARFSLANALRRTGRVQESLGHYAAVLKLDPSVSQASFGYAMGLVRLGRYHEARARLEQDARTYVDQPGFPHALARVLAAAPDDRVRDGARAMAIMRELTKGQQTLASGETIAMVHAELGQFDEAIRWQDEVIAAATEGKRADLLPTLTANLQRYRRGQPCRMPWAEEDPVHRPRAQ
jgi:tetratricopeptide (TPR) repeat protein